MLFKRFCKTALLSSLIVSAPVFSTNLTSIKLQAESFSNQLTSFYLTNTAIDEFQIDNIDHQYLFNYGLVFTVHTNIDQLLTDQVTQGNVTQEHIPYNYSHKSNSANSQVSDELAQLRLTARNLAHQEFSLQKQIDSMQAMSLQSDEQKKSSIDKKIRINQDKMNSLISQRAEVSQQLVNKRMQQTMSDSAMPSLSRAQLYKTMLKQTYQLLCDDQGIQHQLTKEEKLTVIFKGMGESAENSYKDNVISVNKSIIEQCNSNEVSAQQAINNSDEYQY